MNILHKMNSFLLIALGIIFYSCNTTEPANNTELKLTVEDISCSEAWIKLTASGFGSQSVIDIKAENKIVKQVSITGTGIDSTIYIDSLLPNKEYRFSASTGKSNAAEASARTLDTTSHDFTWETFQFGDHGSSLYDVAILNSNDIWAVGEIYLNGETDAYNAVHWNGEKWELIRIPFYTVCGQENRTYYPASSVLAFNSNNVFISMDGRQVCKINSSKIIDVMCPPFSYSIKAMWGIDSICIYTVADNGLIGFYNGQSWKKIESGTKLNLYDIWGDENAGKNEIILAGSLIGTSEGRILLKIGNHSAIPISSAGINNNLTSIWFSSDRAYYAATTDLYYKHSLSDSVWKKCTGVTNYAITSVRGNSRNDVFVSASYGDIIHYNGITWFSYLSQTNLSSGVFSRITVKENIAAAVGFSGNKAVLTIGRRKQLKK